MAKKGTAKRKVSKAKASPKAKPKSGNVIGIDLGGTKVLASLYTREGKLIEERKVPTELKEGWKGLRQQLIAICQELCSDYGPAEAVGIGSAGPLHAPSGQLLDPTNFGWPVAKIAIAKELEKALKIPVRLENDAAAAALAERWKGGAGDDALVVTLGTGLGVGILIDGKLLRGSRGLHPEAGHIVLRAGDKTALCACGVYGCSEALLSGVHFGRRAAERLKMPGLTAKQVAEMARNKNLQALSFFEEYSELLAYYLYSLCTSYYPKKIILTGSFAEASPFFLDGTLSKLKQFLSRRLQTLPIMPEVRVSRLGNRAGSIGAAYVAINEDYALPAATKANTKL